ncbi:NTP transferase domain-containing protein [Halosimplex litoreum]|uniref:NTP transferase domain-containing protein n=1 Tax=Halosimplex litoreum TaxID=1198301 RepID=A0A7T3FYP6_9EURY|nr:bifunctional sugar-1-phosphate nucleotidylyltransferase/acetyltransferase [Halosimplex litoreum]QPV63214.1 NTP transferase domain-containing protein [Halosimplex litoreum]
MSIDTAVVLAAGEGTRLRPLTRNRPKPMLPAANRPILEYVFDALVSADVREIVVVVGYKRGRVQDHFGPAYEGVEIEYVTQHKQLGSGHALLQAREVVDGPALVVNGDRVVDADIVRDVVDEFERSGDPSMAVLERPETSQYGAVVLHEGDVAELVEKPETDEYRLINAGVYAFESSVFDAIDATERSDGELALTDTIGRLMDDGRVRGIRTEGMWVDATYPWDLLAVADEVLARGHVDEPASGDGGRDAGVWVDPVATVHDTAVLQGPVVVGPDCEVGPGAVVGPNAALGQNVTVGANATVRNSVLDTDTRVESGSTLIDAVTGQDVTLGAGTVVPGGPADVRVGRQVFEDQRLGAVVADRVTAEGDASFSPGTLVGPGAHIGTSVRASGRIASRAEVTR